MSITKLRRLWFIISGVLLGLSVLCIGFLGFNLGLDFTGGARWDMQFENEIQKSELENFFASQDILDKKTQIQSSGNYKFLITIQDLPDAEIQNIAQGIRESFGSFEEISYRKVDATIGASFKKKSVYAILTALVGIVLFVAFAFRKIPSSINPWRFGTVAIIALFHDILILLGIFVVLGTLYSVELDLPFITALLATLGFSVNDTIVILDRVRENVRLQKANETFEDSIEKSIKQTLLRSLNTSISTLLPLFGLLIFGSPSIFFFVLALIIGIMIGTYSSIFVAAPILVAWKKISDRI